MADSEKYILDGTAMKCPKCGGTDNLSRNEHVACSTAIVVDEKGRWDWSQTRETKVHWDTSDYHERLGERQWWCGNCNIEFDAPNVEFGG